MRLLIKFTSLNKEQRTGRKLTEFISFIIVTQLKVPFSIGIFDEWSPKLLRRPPLKKKVRENFLENPPKCSDCINPLQCSGESSN